MSWNGLKKELNISLTKDVMVYSVKHEDKEIATVQMRAGGFLVYNAKGERCTHLLKRVTQVVDYLNKAYLTSFGYLVKCL